MRVIRRELELLVDESTSVISDSQWPLTDDRYVRIPLQLLFHLHY